MMTFSSQDFKKIHWALLLLIACLLIAGVAVWGALARQKAATQKHNSLIAAEKEMAANLARARNEEQELRDKITRYETLKQRGIVGAEQRLDWIDLINRIKTTRRLAKLDYEFAPQRKIDAALLPEGADAGGMSIMASQMHLHISLLHEGELLGFLDDLRTAAPALIQVRACNLARSVRGPADPADSAQRGIKPQLIAECTLEWLTLKASDTL
ncbi:hypothetical protein [Rugosibacter aromaticivorans]|uniref:hypothetical protein n=1 Tax=Rugosibacter aromaticivorans TaxID=1565605 RepID=UPI0011F97E26|nr:hypothetical protein [Rugosibacter aromaticivorans]TBR14216.1 MAG: hypothetical protein EPO43_08255 [Rugosibacter sp.]